ncbi:hypothetical protein G9A89_000490, partial [Geosiphon pyriformis]
MIESVPGLKLAKERGSMDADCNMECHCASIHTHTNTLFSATALSSSKAEYVAQLEVANV